MQAPSHATTVQVSGPKRRRRPADKSLGHLMLGTRPVVVRLLVGVGCVCDLILERVWELADAGGEHGRVGILSSPSSVRTVT